MQLTITYASQEARLASTIGGIIPLHAFSLQGYSFKQGDVVPLSANRSIILFTGITLTWDDPTIVGVISPIYKPEHPNLVCINGGGLVRSNPKQEVYVAITCNGSADVITYGQHIADLRFQKLVEVMW